MSDITPLFALLAVLAATLGTVSVWSPRRMAVKAGALAVAFALMGTGYAAMVEDEAIYLWLQLDGVKEPRAYELPWDRRTAEQLQTAARAAAERQVALRMRLPFEQSLDDRDPRFYALPQPGLPPKDALEPPAQIAPAAGSDA
jgi:hypothetical protein